MMTMTTEVRSFLPHGRELTRADLDALPDDGYRYELIDGVLIVSPAPRTRHQDAVVNLTVTLKGALPEQLKVLVAPYDVVLDANTVIQPDLLAAPRDAFTETELPAAPLLAVEVLSPSTRGMDLLLKRERLERAGCPHYWVVDPDEPSIIAWELLDGAYRESARAAGGEVFEVSAPFPVSFTPAALTD